MSKEDALTIAVADYLRLQYPKVLFCHIANERKTTPQRGSKFKKMGVKAGMPDIMIYHQREMIRSGLRGVWSGVAIELKIKPNKPTENQLKTLKDLSVEGWETAVCYSFDEAKKTIDNYLKTVR